MSTHERKPCDLQGVMTPEEMVTAAILGMGSRKCPYLGRIAVSYQEEMEVFYCSAMFDPDGLDEEELYREVSKRVPTLEHLVENCFDNYECCPRYIRHRQLEDLFPHLFPR